MLSRLASGIAVVVLVCSVAQADEPSGNVIRPKEVDAKVPGCSISEPGDYQATAGDLIEIEYRFPIVPTATPQSVDRKWDRGAIYPSRLGIRQLIVPNMVGAGTYLFYFKAKHAGSGTAIVIIDGERYEYRFQVAASPREEVDNTVPTFKNFTVFYNALRTEHQSHLIALGWCGEAGWTPAFTNIGQTGNFRLSFTKTPGGASAQVITPFALIAKIPAAPKSVQVEDDHGTVQVQVHGMKSAGSGENLPGTWVKSK